MRNKKTIFCGNKNTKDVFFQAFTFAISFVMCATFGAGIIIILCNLLNY